MFSFARLIVLSRRVLLTLLLMAVAAGCAPMRRVETVLSAPDVRQQLTHREVGERRALICPTVDTTGLDIGFSDLASDAAQVGYQSTDLPKDLRRRCRRDVNIEHHAWLQFDLSPGPFAREGTLVAMTLSGVATRDPQNFGCGLTRRGPFGGFLAAINVGSPGASLDTGFSFGPMTGPIHRAREARPFLIDDRVVPFRERQLALAEGDTGPRLGSEPNFVFSFSPETVERWREHLSRGGDPTLDLMLIGRENPDMTGDRRCLERLTDLRLLTVFSNPR